VLTTKDQLLPLAKGLMGSVDYGQDKPIRLIGLGVSGHHDDASDALAPQWVEQELDFAPWPDE